MSRNQNILTPIRLPDRNQLIAFIHPQSTNSVIPQIFQRISRQTLYSTVPRHHKQKPSVFFDRPRMNHRLYTLALFNLNNVNNISSLGSLTRNRNLITLFPIDLASVRKEQKVIMR